ncbi:class I SAM-dependent methyltransferase [Kallotenue papyrolyticum]|uniref:class I SAM-dependent methyltransferase n=1 Tax=Kallotenue papyrolyticum TaxID=1325125 RepID=UPI000492D53B|nr:class I SAM-dependent methyltransferase [Kallotenue papyrolyticum]
MMRAAFRALRRSFRLRRYQRIRNLFHLEGTDRFILDLGGRPASFFAAIFPKPEQLILVEIDRQAACQAREKHSALHVIVANGEQLPFMDPSKELTVCNSVIAHVASPQALAREVRHVSRSYFLQTPNGRFPLETHSFIGIPFYNLIPWAGLQQLMCKIFGAGYSYISSVRHLSASEL